MSTSELCQSTSEFGGPEIEGILQHRVGTSALTYVLRPIILVGVPNFGGIGKIGERSEHREE